MVTLDPKKHRTSYVVKNDLICVGDHLSVDSPLRTNGGDIVILASEVHLNAPIDTRIYFDLSDPKSYAYVSGVDPPWESINEIRQRSPRTGEVYDSYYSKCDDCIFAGSAVFSPEMVPYRAVEKRVGYSPPRSELARNGRESRGVPPWDRLRSGSIAIYTESMNVSADLRDGRLAIPKLCPELSERHKSFALNAAGIYGAKPSLGSPPPCVGMQGKGRVHCAPSNYSAVGEPSARGPGGPAGDIFLAALGRGQESFSFPGAFTTTGGPGGIRDPIIHPPLSWPNNTRTPELPLCQFPRMDVGQKRNFSRSRGGTNSEVGESGTIVTESLGHLDAVLRVVDLARLIDSRSRIQPQDLIVRGRTASSFAGYLSAEDYVTGRLYDALADIYSNSIRSLTLELLPDRPVVDSTQVWGVFRNIQIQEWAAIPKRYQILTQPLEQLVRLRRNGDRPAGYEFLYGIGGAFALSDSEILQRVLAERALEDNAELLAISTEQLIELGTLVGLKRQEAVRSKTGELLDSINGVRAQLDAIVAARREARKGGSIGVSLERIGKLVERCQEVAGALSSGNVTGILISTSSLLDSGKYLLTTGAPPSWAAHTQLAKELEIARGRLAAFLHSAALTRADAEAIRQSATSNYLVSRRRITARKHQRVALVEDLVKLALISFALDPTASRSRLSQNLSAIDTFISGVDTQEMLLQLNDVVGRCLPSGPVQDDCVRIDIGNGATVLEIDMLNVTLPAYVISPEGPATASTVRTFGYDLRIRYENE